MVNSFGVATHWLHEKVGRSAVELVLSTICTCTANLEKIDAHII